MECVPRCGGIEPSKFWARKRLYPAALLSQCQNSKIIK
jgi:hypothetical protein